MPPQLRTKQFSNFSRLFATLPFSTLIHEFNQDKFLILSRNRLLDNNMTMCLVYNPWNQSRHNQGLVFINMTSIIKPSGIFFYLHTNVLSSVRKTGETEILTYYGTTIFQKLEISLYTVATDELLCLKNAGTQISMCFFPQMNNWSP